MNDSRSFFNVAQAAAPFPISKTEEKTALKISFGKILYEYPQSTVKKDTNAQIRLYKKVKAAQTGGFFWRLKPKLI